jgi:hypothetical protein
VIESTIAYLMMKIEAVEYTSIFTSFYGEGSFISRKVWLFSYFVTASVLGSLIGILYYRANQLFRILIWCSPIIAIFASVRLAIYFRVDASWILAKLFGSYGFQSGNSNVAVLTGAIVTTTCLALAYLAIRKITIKSGE